MKQLRTKVAMILAVTWMCAVPVAPVAFVGVATTGCSTNKVAEGSDPIVVNAERLQATAFEALDMLMTMEENNRAYLRSVAPEVERAANLIRRDGPNALKSLEDATLAYKRNRTPENKANMETWIKTVEALKATAIKYITSFKAPPVPPVK